MLSNQQKRCSSFPRNFSVSNKKKCGWPAYFVVIAAVLPAVAYLVGFSHYQGHLNAFGVDSDGLPISTAEVYVLSVHSVGWLLLKLGTAVGAIFEALKIPSVLYTLCLLMVGVYGVVKAVRKGPYSWVSWLRGKSNKLFSFLQWHNNDLTKSFVIVGVPVAVLCWAAMFVVFCAVAWWLLPLLGYNAGLDWAKDEIRPFLEHGCHADKKSKWNNCFVVRDEHGQELYKGLLVTRSGGYVVMFNKEGSFIFKQQDNHVLHRTLH